jgi:hypothetical protein
MAWDTKHQSYGLPISDATRANTPISLSNIGNVIPIAAGQSLAVSTDSPNARRITLLNIGSVALTVADLQREYPYGLQLPVGEPIDLITASSLWVMASKIFSWGGDPLIGSYGYVSVSVG